VRAPGVAAAAMRASSSARALARASSSRIGAEERSAE
jgi:hypothetical protein